MKRIFDKLKAKIPIWRGHTYYGLCFGWLTFALIVILVIQSHLFNIWLNILPNEYIVRRTAASAALGFLLFGPALLLKEKTKYRYLLLVSIATSLLFVFQFLYYTYSGGFLQPSAFSYISEGMTVFDTVKTLITYRLLIFLIGPVMVAVVWIRTLQEKIPELTLPKKGQIAMAIIVIASVTFGNGYLFLREGTEGGFAHIYEYKRLYNVNRLVCKVGILNFSLGNLVYFGLQTDKASAADIDFAKKWMNKNRQTSVTGDKFGIAEGRNLIIIQIESFENAVIGEKINGQEITPNLNKLTNEGLYFSNYYAPIGPGTTSDAEFSTLNSLFPLSDRVAFIDYAKNEYTALPNLLKKNGYHTFALHGDVPSFWNRANMYPKLGYEKSFGKKDFIIPRPIGAYDLGDDDFFRQSIPKLKILPQPFMATLITLTSHAPFQIPSDLQKLNFSTTSTLSQYHRDYLQSVNYVDTAIGTFITELKEANLYDNSLIAIYGDHGSFSGIGMGLGKNQTVFSELQDSQVPLILLAPHTDLQGTIKSPASHLDFYPTVAHLLGVEPPPAIFGQDILTTKTPLVIHRNLISGTIKSILTDKLAYQSDPNGIFEQGICLQLPNKDKLPVEACRSLYEKKEDMVRVSDSIIKGNLIPTILGK